MTGILAVSTAGRDSAGVSNMSEIFTFSKGRFALKAALAKHSAVCRTRPLLAVRAYYSNRVLQQQYCCTDVYTWRLGGLWVSWWDGGELLGACQ